MGRGAGPLLGLLWLLPSCATPQFVCTDDSDCSGLAGGRCEAGGACSYPDDTCESGRRLSRWSSDSPGACLPAEAGSSGFEPSTEGTAEPGSTGGPTSLGSTSEPDEGSSSTVDPEDSETTDAEVDLCEDGCAGPGSGTCVVVDGSPTCACEPGWYSVGQSCLDNPCESKDCRFVDADLGDDAGDGSASQPWRTAAHAFAFMTNANAGTHVLFRRGQTFPMPENGVTIDPKGEPGEPVVMGAYGPREDGFPRLKNALLRVNGGEYFVIRDVELEGRGPDVEEVERCLYVDFSAYITLRDSYVHGCTYGGIRISFLTHHTVVFRNELHASGETPVIAIADKAWTDPVETIGEHHWVAQNRLFGSDHRGLRVLFNSALHPPGAVGDIKVVDNIATGAALEGLLLETPVGWMTGNDVFESGQTDGDGTAPAMRALGAIQVEGNVLVGGLQSLRVGEETLVRRNTIVGLGGSAPVMHSDDATVEATGNIVVTAGEGGIAPTRIVRRELDDGLLATWSANAYVPNDAGCVFEVEPDGSAAQQVSDFALWQRITRGDSDSQCAFVPGLELGDARPSDTALTPAASWWGCDEVGAYGCDGTRHRATFVPSQEITENDGFGWAGPLLIRRRYGADPN